MTDPTPTTPPHRVGFLLSQGGAIASARFTERLAALGVTPTEAAVVRNIGYTAGLSQSDLAARMGVPPSRIVALVDSLEARGIVARARSGADRRSYELDLAPDGDELLGGLRRAAETHDLSLTAPLTPSEASELQRLLGLVVDAAAAEADIAARLPGTLPPAE